MNRNQRKYGRGAVKKDNTEQKLKVNTEVNNVEIEEVLLPRFNRNPPNNEKSVANRCCYIKPKQKDVEQSVDSYILDDHFNDLVRQQYDFDPAVPDTIKQLTELRKILCGSTKVENYSQYTEPKGSSYVETSDGSEWQNMDNVYDLEQLLSGENKANTLKPENFDSKNVYISEVPRIRVIAEKFSKFKRNNVELRKLDEKIVCIEYDVFEQECIVDKNGAVPIQTMRAYFSVKPIEGDNTVEVLPSTIKHEFRVTNEDLHKLNEKEIEIIDGNVAKNKSYLDDLKRVLKRKQAIYAKKKKSSLDLKSLYEMAKREAPSLDEDFSNTNLLSKAELEEIKDLITKKCASSIHGINRHTVKYKKEIEPKADENMNVISKSIFAELIRNTTK